MLPRARRSASLLLKKTARGATCGCLFATGKNPGRLLSDSPVAWLETSAFTPVASGSVSRGDWVRRFGPCGTLVLLVGLIACADSPTRPSQSIGLTAPAVISPAGGTVISSLKQPITLIARNAVASQPRASVTDHFEVATDPAFSNIIMSKDVQQDPSGQTSVTLDPLGPNASYYWRARAAAGLIGPVSATASFRIGPAIGSGPYRLRIGPYAFDPSCRFVEFFFDGDLTVTRQTWAFTLPPFPPYGNDLALRLTLQADCFLRGSVCLSGSLVSNESVGSSSGFDDPARVLLSKSAASPGQATAVDAGGVVEPSGLMQGSFTGYLRVDSPAPCRSCVILGTPNASIFPVFGCTDLLGWSLLPR